MTDTSKAIPANWSVAGNGVACWWRLSRFYMNAVAGPESGRMCFIMYWWHRTNRINLLHVLCRPDVGNCRLDANRWASTGTEIKVAIVVAHSQRAHITPSE